MIDILLKNDLCEERLQEFLALVFSVEMETIMIFSIGNFSKMGEIDFSGFNCLCVYESIEGDASKLLQLYRCKVSRDEFISDLQMACKIKNIACYVPSDSFDSWFLIDGDRSMKAVSQIESEDGIFLFTQK
ncbi:hypothetical protein [Variovorax gossypii]